MIHLKVSDNFLQINNVPGNHIEGTFHVQNYVMNSVLCINPLSNDASPARIFSYKGALKQIKTRKSVY